MNSDLKEMPKCVTVREHGRVNGLKEAFKIIMEEQFKIQNQKT